ncbi:MAG TPA: medium chain dehydrogenase/reductase family protein [Vicinamibacteria bacterium]|jgi:NADPH:quinone reductase-like Zn-dependent oxidoreductase|nr:medium chain dehydrogenase/reductase family protein [Vicinamibacteria bacterium]
MRQVWITKAGPPEVLEVREAPDPVAGAGKVRIRVRAAGINFSDLLARVGLYPDAPKLPCVVGYEVAGVVDQVGTGVTGFREGDRVLAMPRFGGYTDVLVISAPQVLPMPPAMTFEEGAALPVVYLTAHHMMFYTGALRPGSRVLIHSAAGGVGLAAIQLAKTRQCIILGTASPAKHEFLRAQGCRYPIDSGGDFVPGVRAAVGNAGLDLILDAVGGSSWTKGYDLLAPCGRLVAFGLSAASSGKSRNLLHALGQVLRIKKWSPLTLMNDNKTLTGVNLGHLFGHPEILGPQLQALIAFYEAGQIRPHVDRSFRFEEAAAAHHYIHDRKAVGKVVLVP